MVKKNNVLTTFSRQKIIAYLRGGVGEGGGGGECTVIF